MVNSVLVNSGRSCISCSGIWASRHTEDIAEALETIQPMLRSIVRDQGNWDLDRLEERLTVLLGEDK